MDDKTHIAYQDVHDYANSISDKEDEIILQNYITFRLENFSKMTIDAVVQLDKWINSLRFITSYRHNLRHTYR